MSNQLKYNFVIITPGRSGSEHLSETLNNYDDIEVRGEVFNRANHSDESFNFFLKSNTRLRLISFFFNREKLSISMLNKPLNYLIKSFLFSEKPQESFRGFKLTLDQWDAYPMIFRTLINSDCKIIYLNREDRLSQTLSLMKARQTGIYHNRTESSDDEKYTFDKEVVKKLYSQTKQWEVELLEKLKWNQYFSLSYEKLFQNYDRSIDDLRVFLSLKKATNYPYSNLSKTNQNSLDKWVSNLDEIKVHLNN